MIALTIIVINFLQEVLDNGLYVFVRKVLSLLFVKTWYNEVLRIQEGSRCVVLSVVVVNQVLLTVGRLKMATIRRRRECDEARPCRTVSLHDL